MLPLSVQSRSSCRRLMRFEIVWKFVSRPPSQRWFTYGMPQLSAASRDRVAGLLLGAHEQHGAAAAGELAGELLSGVQQTLGLLQVDDVDPAALAEDEAAHLGVPAARLVAEVDSGLQQLLDAYLGGQRVLPCRVCGAPPAGRLADPVLCRPGQGRGRLVRRGSWIDAAAHKDRAQKKSEAAEKPPRSVFQPPVWPSGDWLPSCCIERATQFNGWFGLAHDISPVRGWLNINLLRVQELALQTELAAARAPAVLRVAADRMADRREVRADLVGAPGLEPHAQQRGAAAGARSPRSA